MKQMEEEDAREQEELRGCIKGLKGEVEMWQSLYENCRRSSEELEAVIDRERHARQQLELEVQLLKRLTAGSTEAVPLKPRNHRSNAAAQEDDAEELANLTCGKCSNDSRCPCIEDAFKMGDIAAGVVENDNLKRPLSPPKTLDSSKRQKPNKSHEEPTEIDFTTSRLPALPETTSSSTSSSLPTVPVAADSCGFCQDGTPCICAEIIRRNENERHSQPVADDNSNTKPNQLGNACTQTPGTCTQCQSIPASKNFCLSLAESRLSTPHMDSRSAVSSSATAPTLNCADAFSRLAQHPAFPQASTELDKWVPQLATKSVPSTSTSNACNAEGRTAFEFEAASVMNVLKLFDVRFGQNQMKNRNGETSEL